jgi:hypothetical protein
MASLCLGVRVALLAPQQQPLAPKHGYTPVLLDLLWRRSLLPWPMRYDVGGACLGVASAARQSNSRSSRQKLKTAQAWPDAAAFAIDSYNELTS